MKILRRFCATVVLKRRPDWKRRRPPYAALAAQAAADSPPEWGEPASASVYGSRMLDALRTQEAADREALQVACRMREQAQGRSA